MNLFRFSLSFFSLSLRNGSRSTGDGLFLIMFSGFFIRRYVDRNVGMAKFYTVFLNDSCIIRYTSRRTTNCPPGIVLNFKRMIMADSSNSLTP